MYMEYIRQLSLKCQYVVHPASKSVCMCMQRVHVCGVCACVCIFHSEVIASVSTWKRKTNDQWI